ncbi:MAG: pyruvate,water dikinase [Verrucomicrobiales bacterium]
MRTAIHIILFILFFIAPFVVGLSTMDSPPDWFSSVSSKPSAPALALKPSSEPIAVTETIDDAPATTQPEPVPTAESAIPVQLKQETVKLDAKEVEVDNTESPPSPIIQVTTEEANDDNQTDTEAGGIPSQEVGAGIPEVATEADVPQLKKLRRPLAEKIRPLKENPGYFQYSLESRDDFDQLARRDNVPGALGVRELKVLISRVETESPVTFFLNTGRFPYHYCFARDLLSPGLSHNAYKNATYYRQDGRKFLAASLVAHDNFRNEDGSIGAYIISFWPTDPVNFHYASMAYDLIVDQMNFEHAHVYFQPSGTMQEELYMDEKAQFDAAEVPVILAEDFYSNFAFSPLNTGTSYGRLLMADPASTYSARDIVVFKNLPNDLSVAAGIITEAPQTPLSHINLKAQQNGIPNAYLRAATTNETLTALAGEYVRYEVTSDSWRMTKATDEEVEAFLEASRPPASPPPVSNLRETSIKPLSDLGFLDAKAYGAKAANVAELGKILYEGTAPKGFAVPFFLYNEFMKSNGFYEEAQEMIEDETFRADASERRKRLKAFRTKIKDAEAPEWMLLKLGALQNVFPEGAPLRCRSSTNNEDMEGFNGAGLYNSYTHRPDEGHLIKSMKQVWSSLWTYRAFEEREFYRVDHMLVYMGVLVHPNYDDEQANGVGITRNIFDPRWLGFYVNVQVGENLITNPEDESVPEEFLVSVMTGGPQDQAYSLEIQYARRSNKVPKGESVLTREQAIELARNMRTIHRHFRDLYKKQYDDTFAMDIEFKIDAAGKLVIKQARPWVWPNLPSAEDTDC